MSIKTMNEIVGNAVEENTDFTLRDCVKKSIDGYLKALADQKPQDLYEIVVSEMEIPLFEEVLKYTNGVELRAAKVLGIARGTLRAKLKKHSIEKNDFKDQD